MKMIFKTNSFFWTPSIRNMDLVKTYDGNNNSGVFGYCKVRPWNSPVLGAEPGCEGKTSQPLALAYNLHTVSDNY